VVGFIIYSYQSALNALLHNDNLASLVAGFRGVGLAPEFLKTLLPPKPLGAYIFFQHGQMDRMSIL
jgi:hypothetical protein